MSKRCGNCRHFSYTDGDRDARDYPSDDEWGFCHAPVPMYVDDFSNGEVSTASKAKKCPTYKRLEK